MITNEFLESLGWEKTDTWQGRGIYELHHVWSYSLMDHNGDISLIHDGQFYHYSLNEEDIKKLTVNLIEKRNMMERQKDYTIYDYTQNHNQLLDYMSEWVKR